MYTVRLSRSAIRFFEEAQGSLRRALDRCWDQLSADPRRHPNIRPLKGRAAGHYRYRVGDYRVVYRIDDSERLVHVSAIGHRRDIYR